MKKRNSKIGDGWWKLQIHESFSVGDKVRLKPEMHGDMNDYDFSDIEEVEEVGINQYGYVDVDLKGWLLPFHPMELILVERGTCK